MEDDFNRINTFIHDQFCFSALNPAPNTRKSYVVNANDSRGQGFRGVSS